MHKNECIPFFKKKKIVIQIQIAVFTVFTNGLHDFSFRFFQCSCRLEWKILLPWRQHRIYRLKFIALQLAVCKRSFLLVLFKIRIAVSTKPIHRFVQWIIQWSKRYISIKRATSTYKKNLKVNIINTLR